METPYVLISNIQIHNTYADIFCKMTQAADNCNTHRDIHRHTQTHALRAHISTLAHSLVGVMTHLALSSICLANEDL